MNATPRLRPTLLCLTIASLLPTIAAAETAAADAFDGQVRTLDALQVTGERGRDVTSYTVESSSRATGLDLSLRQTPQTVTVVTRQQIEDRQLRSLDDVLTGAPGITASSNDVGARTSYRARGFAISNYRVDGMQIGGSSDFSGSGQAFNMDLYESAQIVRGANGLLGGTGDPSATVDLQRKRPERAFGGTASLTVGSWDRVRAAGDLSVPITADGDVRALLAVSNETGDGFRDHETVDRRAALLHLVADIGERTRVSAGFQSESNRLGGASWGANVPIWYADGSWTDLPRSTNPVADWSVSKRGTTTAFAGLEQAWANGWTLRANIARTRSDALTNSGIAKPNNISGALFGGFWNQDGTGAHLNGFHSEGDAVRDNIDVSLDIPLQFAGREHQLMLGFNGYEQDATSYTFNRALGNCSMGGLPTYSAGSCQYRAGAYLIPDWRTWDGSAPRLETFRTNARTVDTTRLYGGYVAGRFELADPLHLIVGARLSQYEVWRDTYTAANTSTRGNGDRERDVITPYAGIVYDISQHFSLYASHTDVFTPQGDVRDANDRRLDPLTGKSQEAGIKGEFFGGALNASFAVFRNLQNGLAQSTNTEHPDTGLTIYRAVDGVESKGAELEINGRLAPGWNVSGGYAWLSVDGLGYQRDPRHLLRLNSTYTLPGAWSRLTVGGGVTVQSETEWSTNPGRPTPGSSFRTGDASAWDTSNLFVGGHTRFDLMARYDLTARTQIAANIRNAGDKTYYSQYGFYDGLIYAEPRSYSLTLRTRF